MRSPSRVVLAALIAALFLTPLVAPASSGPEPVGGETIDLIVPAGRVTGIRADDLPAMRLGWTRVTVPASAGLESAIALAESTYGPGAYPERRYQLLHPADEPFFDDQWYMHNTGQEGGVPGADVNALGAWSVTRGNGVVVAVVDTGIQSGHPEFTGRMWVNPGETLDGTDSDGNGLVDDLYGWDFWDWDNDPVPSTSTWPAPHGTAVAGLIAAAVNDLGITGLAPQARLMNLRACGDECPSWAIAAAIVYAVDMGADVITMSLGASAPDNGPGWDPVLYDAYTYARDAGVVIATAAGNTPPDALPDGHTTIIPGSYPHSNNLGVAATTPSDTLASFSFYGPDTHIAAPGTLMWTTHPDGWIRVDGTSFAAPLVAAAAALVIADTPGATHHEVVGRVKDFAKRLTALDDRVQSGRLDAGMAVRHRFVDSVGHLFETEITWLARQGITRGCNPPTNTRFCPNDRVTRAQMAAFVRRTFAYPSTTQDFFEDDNGSIFENDINAIAAAGVTRGCNPPANTLFCPGQFVTRGQMAAFLRRALSLPASSTDWFVDDNGHLFEADINALAEAGITRGCNPPANNHFCPDQFVTRGQMAAFIRRMQVGS